MTLLAFLLPTFKPATSLFPCAPPLHPIRRPPLKRLRPIHRVVLTAQPLEPVEDGVQLPLPPDIPAEAAWLAAQLTGWLDAEWRHADAHVVHAAIGARAGQIYARQRMEGEHDLTSVLLAMGQELEAMDFGAAFVGAWNVANKSSELLLERCKGRAAGVYEKDPGAPTWASVVAEKEARRREEEAEEGEANGGAVGKGKVEHKFASAPSLADRFERLKFLREVLDEEIPKQMVDGAVAAAVGFRYDAAKQQWDGSEVEDAHFRKFGDTPPEVIGADGTWTETMGYLQRQLEEGAEGGEAAKGLDMIVETLHGVELTKVQMAAGEEAFRKRVVVVKWLHLLGGF